MLDELLTLLRIRGELYAIYSQHTGKPVEQIFKDAERDNYMSPEQAKEYRIIDTIMTKSAMKELGGGVRIPLTSAVQALNEKVNAEQEDSRANGAASPAR